MKNNPRTMDKDKWIKIFIATKDISGARNRRRHIRIFGVSLARSDPKGLFNHSLFNGTILLETSIAAAWAAACTLCGPGWLNATIELDTTIAPAELFLTYPKKEVQQAKPFKSEEMYADDSNSLHNLEITMKKLCKVKSRSKSIIEPEVWTDTMRKHFPDATVKSASEPRPRLVESFLDS
jgi:hypothetical protein